jgi:phospholipid/cholesterol/gamma-HCH transport system ATP-binding protein
LEFLSQAGKRMIRLEGLYKKFESKQVLCGLDLEIQRGETMVIIGRSGEGKSVLLKCVMNLIEPDAGSIWFEGREVLRLEETERDRLRQRFGMLFQSAALFDSLTVADNVSFGLRRLTNYSETRIRELVKEKLALVGLKGIEHLKPAELSGGMKKRVGLARAIAMNPEVILYDEPTTGIDPIMADAINDLIRQMQKKLSVTSLVVTHDMTSAYKIADRIAMLHQGKIVETGTPERIKHSRSPLVRQFVTGSAQGPISLI